LRLLRNSPAGAAARPPSGIVSAADLRQDAFVALVEGSVRDLEEFTYDTRFVLDVRDVHEPLLLQIPRSMLGNVVIRLVRVGRDVRAGLFVGRTPLTGCRPADDVALPAGEPLRFGIDCLPAVVDDVGRWIGWTCPDADQASPGGGIRPSRDERELQAAMRQIEAKRAKGGRSRLRNEQKVAGRAAKEGAAPEMGRDRCWNI
jgi:hypothetical protein